MAARISVRRRSRVGGRSLTAASQRITNPSKTFKTPVVGSGEAAGKEWQQQAWDYYDIVGELSYYVNWRSSAVSRCKLVASDVDPETGDPTGATDNQDVIDIVNAIGGGVMGAGQLLARMTALLTVPGEGYLAMLVRDPSREETVDKAPPVPGENGIPEPGTEQWFAFSREEINRKPATPDELEVVLPDGVKHAFDPDVDVMFRVWNPHPRKAGDATSPVRSNLAVLNEIVRATVTIDNASKSRLVGNGILFVPQEMSLPVASAPTAAPPTGAPAVPPPVPQMMQASSQQLQDLLYEVATTAFSDQTSLAAFLPIIAASPGEWIKNVTHLRFDSTVPETALATRDKGMERLARGLDVSPERLLGLGDSNHWTAWALDENDVKVHIAPPLEVICAALTQSVLREALRDTTLDPDAFVVWYDATDLTQDPDKTDEASDAYDKGVITGEALRRYYGFDEADGYDLTKLDGWKQLARDRAAQDVSLIPMLAPLLGDDVADIDAPAQPAPPAIEGEEPPPTEEPPEPPDNEEPEEDGQALPAAVGPSALVRLCVNRALELAAKRRRTRATEASYRGRPLHLVHRFLPPMTVAEASKAIAGWDDSFDDATAAAFGVDPADIREAVATRAVKVLTSRRL